MTDDGWRQYTLGEVVTLQRGFDITKKEQVQGPHPVISSSGINSYHNAYKIKGPGVVVGRKGSLGTVFYVEENYWPHDTTLWVNNFHDNIPRFCYYFLKTMQLERFDSGAANPTLNRNHIHSLLVRIPSVPIQKKITEVLGAFDDLVEVNLRRIGVLEELARGLYDEWFVRLRFPAHEDTEITQTEHGPTPKGWKYELIGKVIETLGGGTPSTNNNEFWDNGNIEWYTPSDLTSNNAMFITGSSRKITKKGLQKSSAKLFPAYSVMMTSRATVGVVSINTKEACTNQGFIICVPNEKLSKYYLFFWIKNNLERILNLASGATFKEINKTTFRNIPILIPDSETTKLYIEKMEPMGALIENLLKKNLNLKKCSDMLFPKLISGEIDISDIDIAV